MRRTFCQAAGILTPSALAASAIALGKAALATLFGASRFLERRSDKDRARSGKRGGFGLARCLAQAAAYLRQEKRIARAKEMRRVRSANVVTPEHYRYVIRDLRMTGILAALMFTVIIVLHFVLS